MSINIAQIFTETAKDFCIKEPFLEMQNIDNGVLTIKLMSKARQNGSYNYTFENIKYLGNLENHVLELRMLARTMAVRLSTYEEPIT